MSMEWQASLTWTDAQRVHSASGACEAVLGRPAQALLGLPLPEALWVEPGRAAALLSHLSQAPHGVEFLQVERASSEARATLRLEWRRTAQGLEGTVVDVGRLLEGAPPVQISGLASSLSHEIRNPLSSVKMAVQTLARNTGLSDRDKRRLTIANREIRTMERMLWLLSEYGRDSRPHLEPLPLRAVVQEAAALVAPELAERRVELVVDEAPGLPRARVDLNRLRPVLAQVLLNVAMGQPEDSQLPVALRPAPDGERVLLRVEDRAAALPEGDRATLFEPFGSRLARGAGLSLAALHRVLLGLGGEVQVEGSEQPGMVFTLAFPSAW